MNYQVSYLAIEYITAGDTIFVSNGDAIFQALDFYGISTTATCEYADDTKFTGAEIWEGSDSGDYLEAVLEKMYTDRGNYESKFCSSLPLCVSHC